MKRYKVRPTTWYCVECARGGRPYVYVPNAERVCPYGHESKSRKPSALRLPGFHTDPEGNASNESNGG